MKIGYARISKIDGSQALYLQHDALFKAGVDAKHIYNDKASGKEDERCGKLIFGIFAALAEFERELIRERTKAGLAAARARGRCGGRKFALTKAQVRLAQAAMGKKETVVSELCDELGITRATLYRYLDPKGQLRDYGKRVLSL